MESLTCEYQGQVYVRLQNYNVILFNFESIIDSIYKSFYEALHEYNILNSKSQDSVKILWHCTIIELQHAIKKIKPNSEVVIFFRSCNMDKDLYNIQKIVSKLPYYVIYSNASVDTYVKQLNNNDHEAIVMLEKRLRLEKNKRYKKFRAFLKRNGLVYLTNTFLKQHYNKMTLLR